MSTNESEEKAFQEAASLLIHRLRNPLGGIKGFASLLKRDLEGQPNLQKMAAMIVEGADNLDRIMTAALDFAEPLNLNKEPCNLIPMIKEVFDHHQISWTTSIDTANVYMDKSQMRKALSYLSDFAAHPQEKGSFPEAQVNVTDSNIAITFVDQGTVIPKDRVSKVFSPFFVAPWGGEEGALAQAKKIICSHGGTMEIYSSDNGTTIIAKIARACP